jgi:hypothetical protein
VLDVFGRSLVEYKSSYEMVAAVRNGIIGEFCSFVLKMQCDGAWLLSP